MPESLSAYDDSGPPNHTVVSVLVSSLVILAGFTYGIACMAFALLNAFNGGVR